MGKLRLNAAGASRLKFPGHGPTERHEACRRAGVCGDHAALTNSRSLLGAWFMFRVTQGVGIWCSILISRTPYINQKHIAPPSTTRSVPVMYRPARLLLRSTTDGVISSTSPILPIGHREAQTVLTSFRLSPALSTVSR